MHINHYRFAITTVFFPLITQLPSLLLLLLSSLESQKNKQPQNIFPFPLSIPHSNTAFLSSNLSYIYLVKSLARARATILMNLHNRKLFLWPYTNDAPFQATSITYQNTTASTSSTLLSPSPPQLEEQYSSQIRPFDSSMALTILVLLTALFFLGFFSIYLRRFSNESSTEISSRSHQNAQTTVRPPRVVAGRKGLDPKVVKSLPVYNYYCGEVKYKIEECPICLGEFAEKDSVKLIPYCGHVFHLECIDTWLGIHVTCPVCRGTQFLEKGVKKKRVDESGGSRVEDLCGGSDGSEE